MRRIDSSRARFPRLLYDAVEVATILNTNLDTVCRLCELGELKPSITIGARRLFSMKDLERFINPEAPKRIVLPDTEIEGVHC